MVPVSGAVSLVHLARVSAGHVAEQLLAGRWVEVASQGPTEDGAVAEGSAPKALRQVVEHAPMAFAVLAALAVAVVVVSRVRARRSLSKRVVFVALPTETFDPSAEEIVRFAGLLLRCRRGTRGLSSRRTDSVRLRLSSLPGGRLIQSVEGPRRAESVLRLGGYAEVDLRTPESIDLGALSAIATSGALAGDDDNDAEIRDRSPDRRSSAEQSSDDHHQDVAVAG